MVASKHFLIDMDGVLVRGSTLIPGADRFIDELKTAGKEYLVLTNNSLRTPRDLAHRLQSIGLDIPAERIFSSAQATARFLQSQRPDGTAFVIGESGLTEAIHEVGYVITDMNPDYVVLGETDAYNFAALTHAIRMVAAGSRFIATNPDTSGPAEGGIVPGCGATAALIEKATGRAPFFVGKPNPYMMRSALNYLDVHSEDTVMIGDNMQTDIIGGIESGMETVLVLSGVATMEEVDRYPYRPSQIVDSVASLEL